MSRTKAINDKCKDCIYDPAVGGTWREQVEACTSQKSCALWPFRPVTTASIAVNRKLKNGSSDEDFSLLVDGLEDDDTVEA